MSAVVHHGDCLDVMRSLPACSVDAVVTDPPYGIRFMGKAWDGADIEAEVSERRAHKSHDPSGGPNGGHKSAAAEAGKYDTSPTANQAFQEWTRLWAIEAMRVLKPGGWLLSFASTRTYHRMTVGLEDAGFEIRDQIGWAFGSGFPKSHNGDWGGTALKPAWEPIALARKPLIGTVEANWREHGTGALNIDGCRVLAEKMAPNTGAGGLPRRHADEQRGPGLVAQPHDLGRWPANLIHDGSDEVVSLFPANAGAQSPVKGTERSAASMGLITGERGRVPGEFHGDTGSAARFFYCAKAAASDRDEGLDDEPDRILAVSNQAKAELARGNLHQGNSGMNTAKVRKNNHPTVKPTDLMRYLCRLVTPAGGVVLDPFTGSGSTGKAAVLEGLQFIGAEREADYVAIARTRIEHAQQLVQEAAAEAENAARQTDLFAEFAHD